MDWLVDTNILIDHLRGVPKATTFLRQARSAGTLWLSAITVAQGYAGQLFCKGCSGSVWVGGRKRQRNGAHPFTPPRGMRNHAKLSRGHRYAVILCYVVVIWGPRCPNSHAPLSLFRLARQ